MFKTSRIRALFFVFLLAFSLGTTAVSTEAHADIRRPGGGRTFSIEPHLGFGYYQSAGALGVRFSLPILQNGFIPGINNAVFFNFGVDVYSNFSVFSLGIPLTLNWSFYFTRRFSMFLELGANIFLNSGLFSGGGFQFGISDWLTGALGFRFKITPKFALLLRVGSPYSSLGVEIFM